MDRRSPGRIIAGCFALCGFAVATFASLGVGATVETILLRSIFGLVICYIVGAVIGAVGERCIREGFESFASRHQVPQSRTLVAAPVGDSADTGDLSESGGTGTARNGGKAS